MKNKSSVVLTVISIFVIASMAASAFLVRPAPTVHGGLPTDRAAMYRAELAKLTREAPYYNPPQEPVVARLVADDLQAPGKEDLQQAIEEYNTVFHKQNSNDSRPNPMATLGRMKQLEAAKLLGQEPAALSGTAKLLTVMMNFNGSHTFTTDDEVLWFEQCLTDYAVGTEVTITGPQFNETPMPDDNWTPWVDPATSYTGGSTEAYWDLLMFSTTGYTQPIRADLYNPWSGDYGFDYSGVSFKNYYLENSRGIYDVEGDVYSVEMPGPVSDWGAASCSSGRVQDNSYYGPGWRVAISAAEMINSQYPGFDWTQWDVEDVFDWDNDLDFHEPDGYVDHFFLLQAGYGQDNEMSIWPHSWDVDSGNGEGPAGFELGGYKVSNAGPRGGVWVYNYTVSDELGGLGVLVHEYGHDLGLPDNYSYTSYPSSVGFWDQMDSGTFGGGLNGMHPTHQSIWNKYEPYLGWNSPVEIDVTTHPDGEENAVEFYVGQQSKPPAGTVDGLRIILPPIETYASIPPYSGNYMWWSDNGDDREEMMEHTFTVTAGETVTITAQMSYAIEEDWDYLYWEYYDGSDWVQLPVYDSDGVDITTDTDPYGQNLGNGITGTAMGWAEYHTTIVPSGSSLMFRFHYFCDAAAQEEGVYLDDIGAAGSVSGEIFFDDVESGSMWTVTSEGLNDTTPWRIFTGVDEVEHSYLVEWRNSGEGTGFGSDVTEQEAFEIAGFDVGLNRMYYVSELSADGANIGLVDRFHLHTPGMLVWYADGRYNDNNTDPARILNPTPSYGLKGRLALVDANPDPYWVWDWDLGWRKLTERRSGFDAAFTLDDRPEMSLYSNYYGTKPAETIIPAKPADTTFRDRIGATPGYGIRINNGSMGFLDSSAGVVLPTNNNVQFWMPDARYGSAGNPGVNGIGVNIKVVEQAEDGSWGKLKFWLDNDTVFLDQKPEFDMVIGKGEIPFTVNLKDAAGTRAHDDLRYEFSAWAEVILPPGAVVDPDSLSWEGKGIAALQLIGPSQYRILWSGSIGAERIDTPDAVLHFVATFPQGCNAVDTNLYVGQEILVDDFANNGDPFLWPKHDIYSKSMEVCTGSMFMPFTAVTAP